MTAPNLPTRLESAVGPDRGLTRFSMADKAHKLAKAGKSGPEIAKAIGVKYASVARAYANVGAERVRRDRAALTAPELLLITSLAAVQQEMLERGEVSSPKGKQASWRARKSESWAASTAAKRLCEHRKGEDERHRGTGLRLVHASRNGHMWLTSGGWALVQALRAHALGQSND